MPIPDNIKTYVAWTFTRVLPGTFKRNKKIFAQLNYPILTPLPNLKSNTRPIEERESKGPFIYFVLDGGERLCYLDKSKESSLIKRWVRPALPGRHRTIGRIPSHQAAQYSTLPAACCVARDPLLYATQRIRHFCWCMGSNLVFRTRR